MTKIELDASHEVLIQSAIELGNWLRSLHMLSEEEQDTIQQVQDALQNLPTVNDNTLAMYGFSIEQGNEKAGLVRGWDISLEYFSNDEQAQGGLEIFSSYLPIPESTDKVTLELKAMNEAYFHWPVNSATHVVDQAKSEQWIKEVKQPSLLLESGDTLRIEVVYQDNYVEKTFTIN